MKGYIKIEATTHEGREGLSVQTDLEHVTYMDRLQVLHSLCHSLNIGPKELKFMAELMDSGLMNEVVDIEALKDDDDEPQEAKKKKPNVHVIGLESDGDGIAELLKMLLK